ncbi:MAG: hypothetical protein Q4G19_02765 [Clostridia bacterium]|nr:hypothetical protein [Clostridia bacterium]
MEYIDEYLPTESSRIRMLARSAQPLPCISAGQITSVDTAAGTVRVQPDPPLPPLPAAKPAAGLTLHPGDRCLIAFAGHDIREAYVICVI